MNPRGMSIPDAAAYVGLSVSTLRRLIDERQILTRRVDRRVIVDVASLIEWFDALPTDQEAS